MSQTTMNGHHLAKEQSGGRLRWVLVTLFILWLILVVSSFFVVNKPLDATFGQNLAQVAQLPAFSPVAALRPLLDVAAAVWLSFLALGVGLWLWQRIGLSAEDVPVALVFSISLGFGLLGVMTLFLGLLGLPGPLLLYGLLSILTLLTAPRALRLLGRLSLRRPPAPVTVYLLLVVGMAFTRALLPPTSWDGLFYHLKGPKIALQAGQIQPGIDIPHLNFPPLFDMLFLLGMAIRGDVAAKLLHFGFSLLLGGVVYLSATRLLKMKSGWSAVVFLYAIPLVPILAAWAYNDLALSTFGLAALYTFLVWRQTGENKWLVVSGLSSGLMMGMKYTAFVTPLLLAALVLWEFRRGLRGSVRSLLAFVLPASLLLLPWLLKNWAFTGNPVYPFLFGGQFWDSFRAAAYSDAGSGIGFDLPALLRLPLDMTLGYADASQEGTIGPFFLIFLPLLLAYAFSRRRREAPPALSTMLLFAAVSYAFWTWGVIFSRGLWQARLLLPGLVVLCPVLAWILDDLWRFDHPQFSLRRFLRLSIGFVLLLLLISQMGRWLAVNPLGYLSGNESREAYLERRLGAHYLALETINETLPESAVVSFLWEPRSYYCNRECRPDSILDRFNHMEHLYDDAGSIAARWAQEGVTHVLLYDAGLNFVLEVYTPLVTPEDVATLRELQQEYLTPVASWEGAYTLYALQEKERVER